MTHTRTALVIGGGIAGPVAAMALPARPSPRTSRTAPSERRHPDRSYQVNDDGSGGWFVNLPHREPITLTQTREVSAERWLALLGDAFADDRGPALDILRRTEPAELLIVGPMEDLRDPPHQDAFTAYEQLRRSRVEKIIAVAARTNNDKAAGPIARGLRDLLLPTAMKLLAKPEKMAWQYDYRIDWDTPVSDVSHQLARPA